MGYRGVYATDTSNKECVASAVLSRIDFYFRRNFQIVDYEVDLGEQVVYVALKFEDGTVSAAMCWYVFRNYPEYNILFDCDCESCYYDWLEDFPYADCPPRILSKLTPTSDITAKNWRAACWRNAFRRNDNDQNALPNQC